MSYMIPIERPAASCRLLCFPHSGSGASAYRFMGLHLPEHVELCLAELPGRGRRHHEPLQRDFGALLGSVLASTRPLLDKPCLFFGYSLGALVAFELARLVKPALVIVSASRAPEAVLSRPSPPRSTLSDESLIRVIQDMGGTPPEITNDKELMRMALPVLRADFSVLESYPPGDRPRIETPLLAIGGEDDPSVPISALEEWSMVTSRFLGAKTFPGGHFFLQDRPGLVMPAIMEAVSSIFSGGSPV